jgi:hypothetical protein
MKPEVQEMYNKLNMIDWINVHGLKPIDWMNEQVDGWVVGWIND